MKQLLRTSLMRCLAGPTDPGSSSTQVFALGNKTYEHFNAMASTWTSGWNSSGPSESLIWGWATTTEVSPPP